MILLCLNKEFVVECCSWLILLLMEVFFLIKVFVEGMYVLGW